MDSQIKFESPLSSDAKALLEIHAAAVHQTAASAYSPDILDQWARRPITCDRIDRIRQGWIENPENRMVVARCDGRVVGFGFIAKDSELQGLYVHPDYGRRGIGASIFAALEQEAIGLGLSHLKVSASLNAEAFYRKQGFEVIGCGVHRLGSGQEIACVKMRKSLSEL